jgi:predicted ATPase
LCGSAGQHAAQRFASIFVRAKDEVEDLSGVEHRNDYWQEKHRVGIITLEPKISGGQRTVLLDEPDANLDWPNKLALWQWVQSAANEGKVQFIVASHSPFALRLKNANYIELKKGYRELCLKIVREAGLWKED